MADWKVPMSYSYSPSYHAYAYGLMYPQAPEQTHANMSWTEAAYGSSVGVPAGYYTPQPPSSQTPPGSPGYSNPNSEGHYPGSVMYYTDSKTHTQNGRLFLSNNQAVFEQTSKEQERAGSDTPSDSEAHTPDSWSSGSSREGSTAPVDVDLSDWVGKEQTNESNSDGPDGSEVVSSSRSSAAEGPNCMPAEGDYGMAALSPEPVAAQQPRKAKARTAFSEKQMNALNDRFNVQRYLTPAEMKTLAGLTGLTYKQVKTWFQNRRMKLKRHQKDNSWVSERYITAGMPNAHTTHPQFQVDAQILPQDLYNPQFREAVFKSSTPQTTSCYMNYSRPLSPSQVSPRPQGNWRLPPAVQHYEFLNPSSYVPVGGNTTGTSDGTVDPGSSPTQMATVHTATQWSS
ncbi:Homeobox protein NANOG [Bagarius yarrelli]|uniref:Homeobox protein NANOG n=1 Tax=Bagarius yarrelli TaxID=175774 RepID=A0A556U1C7_BAGYA|nr:Homeobox protein NANOG [Bagarius yarrelli]